MINMVRQVLAIGFRLITTIVLSRLLLPSTFGLLAMVTFFSGIMTMLSGYGFVESAIQKKDLSLDELNGVFWLNASVCTLLALVFIACGPLIGQFYGEPELAAMCLVVGLLFILQNLFLTHDALLRRTMNAEVSFVIFLIPQFVSLTVSISMALIGFGVWSLIGGSVLSSITCRLLFLYFVRWSPSSFKRSKDFGTMLRYGLKSMSASIVNYLSNYSQNLALGKFGSATDVGFYNRGQAVFMMPIQQVSQPIAQMILPSLASLQDDRKKMLDLLLRASWLIALITVPFAIFMAIYGDWFIVWLLGNPWKVSGEVTQWLAVASIPQLISNLLARGNAAIGRPGRGVVVVLLSLPILLYGIYLCSFEGAVSVAKFYAIYRWLFYPISISYHLKGSGFNVSLFLRSQLQLLFLILVALMLLFAGRSYFQGVEGLGQIPVMLCACLVSFGTFYLGFRRFLFGKLVFRWLYDKFGQRFKLPKNLFI
jgi:PST family polysaccharide transporter